MPLDLDPIPVSLKQRTHRTGSSSSIQSPRWSFTSFSWKVCAEGQSQQLEGWHQHALKSGQSGHRHHLNKAMMGYDASEKKAGEAPCRGAGCFVAFTQILQVLLQAGHGAFQHNNYPGTSVCLRPRLNATLTTMI